MSLADAVAKDRGQPGTVRVGIVVSVSPFQVSAQGTLFRDVGVLGDYAPMVGDVVALLGQSAVSADGSSWLVLGRIGEDGAAQRRLGVIRRGLRTTNSTGTTTEVGVLRIDGIPVAAGRLYRVRTATSMIFSSTVANDLLEARLYYSLGGTAAIGVNQFGVLSIESRTAGGSQYTDAITAFLPSPGTGTLSVLLSIARTAGTGTVSIPASATYPVHMTVEDLGPDPGNTGISI